MNTQRFGIPVIIAAGLHGTLFLISKEPETIVDIAPPVKIIEVPLKSEPPERIEMQPETPADSSAPSGGPVKALPETPEVVIPLRGDEPFLVPISTHRPTPETITDLKEYRGLPPGTDIGIGEWGAPSIPDVHKLDRVPRAMVQNSPTYPDALRRDGIDGSVIVEFVVGTDGNVLKAEAVKWTRREFVEPAVRAVLRWRFEPGTQGGRKVSFRMAVPIEFNAER